MTPLFAHRTTAIATHEPISTQRHKLIFRAVVALLQETHARVMINRRGAREFVRVGIVRDVNAMRPLRTLARLLDAKGAQLDRLRWRPTDKVLLVSGWLATVPRPVAVAPALRRRAVSASTQIRAGLAERVAPAAVLARAPAQARRPQAAQVAPVVAQVGRSGALRTEPLLEALLDGTPAVVAAPRALPVRLHRARVPALGVGRAALPYGLPGCAAPNRRGRTVALAVPDTILRARLSRSRGHAGCQGRRGRVTDDVVDAVRLALHAGRQAEVACNAALDCAVEVRHAFCARVTGLVELCTLAGARAPQAFGAGVGDLGVAALREVRECGAVSCLCRAVEPNVAGKSVFLGTWGSDQEPRLAACCRRRPVGLI